MEIWTLLKSNIRHKKGSFISIILLMIVVTMSLSSIISAKDNVLSASAKELERLNSGNIVAYIKAENLTDELMQSIQNHELTKDIVAFPGIVTEKMVCGSGEYANGMFMQKLRPGYRVFNERLNGYKKDTPALKKGEIYIPLGMRVDMPCEVGDTITAKMIFGDYNFKIKGFITEPVNGSAMIGWKQLFVSDDDFDTLTALCREAATDKVSAETYVLHICKDDDCGLSDNQFRRQLNIDTGFSNKAVGSLTKEQSIYYTNLFPVTILNIFVLFVMFLFAIVLIVTAHSITTSIEMEYVSFGVLKSQGFSSGKISAVLALQYLAAQLLGTIIGVALSFPLVKLITEIFQPLNAIIADSGISITKVSVLLVLIFAISAFFILLATRKIAHISPVRALCGGRSEIYFSSRLNAPIHKKGLTASLAFRQFTSAKRQYAGIILIVSILVFFMMTMMISGNAVSSRAAMESMGAFIHDCQITITAKLDDEKLEEIKNDVSEISDITKTFYANAKYLSVNGEQIYTFVLKKPEEVQGLLRGRAPIYDNEVMITDIIADSFGVDIGDTLLIAQNDNSAEYLIVGSFQSLNDTGMTICLGANGAERLGKVRFTHAGYNIADKEKLPEIVKMLNEKHGDILEAQEFDEAGSLGLYQNALSAMKLVVYLFSVIFALVVVNMVCKKAFLKEKTDIGIYKALGFTANKLRMQFALRYTIAAVIGSAFGVVLSLMFSGKTLNALLRIIGITNYAVSYTPETIIFPIGIICFCFFLFAYIAARKVKNVEVKELVSE